MTLTAGQIQYMVEEITADLIRMTMDNEGLSMPEAFSSRRKHSSSPSRR